MESTSAGRGWLFVLLLGVTLIAPFALLAQYAKPQTDDFGCGEIASRDGVFAETKHFYSTWTGRYSSSTVLAWCGLDLERAAVTAPLVLMAAWWLSCWRFLFVAGIAWLGRPPPNGRWFLLQTAAGSCLALGVYITRMPSPCQGFFWLSGSLTYMPAGVLSWLLLAELVRLLDPQTIGRRKLLWHALTGAVLVAVLVGFNEVLMLLWDLSLAILLICAAVLRWRWGWVFIILASAAIASAVVINAPGNAARTQGQKADRHQVVKSLGRATVHTVGKVAIWSLDPGLWIVSLLLLPMLRRLPPPSRRWQDLNNRRAIVMIGGATLTTLMLGAFPVYWAMGNGPPLRASNLMYVVFAAGWFGCLYCLAQTRPRFAALWAVRGGHWYAVLALFAFGNWPRAVWDLSVVAPEYRRQIAARADVVQEARSRGVRHLEVDALARRPRTLVEGDLSPDPSSFENQIFARRWNLASVRVREPIDAQKSATRAITHLR